MDAEIVSVSLRRATRTDAFLAVLPKDKSSTASPSTAVPQEVDLKKLRALAFEGIPDNDVSGGLRAKVWKILLDYLPPNKVTQSVRILYFHVSVVELCVRAYIVDSSLGGRARTSENAVSAIS